MDVLEAIRMVGADFAVVLASAVAKISIYSRISSK
jgi:hypothetical protein